MPTSTTPKVSVIMLAYNQEQYIDRAIESVLAQRTTFAIRLIIADDASTDNTRQHCLRWQQRFPHAVTLLPPQPNLGLARNFMRAYAAAQATGARYAAICEGDDFWLSRHKLQRQADLLDTHPQYSLCFHNAVNYYQSDHTKSLSNWLRPRTLTLHDLTRCNPITNVTVVYRLSCVPALPDWMAQVKSYDVAMHTLCAEHGDIRFMPQPMAAYRKLTTSIWTGAGAEQSRELARSVRELLARHFRATRPDISRDISETIGRSLLFSAAALDGEGQSAEAGNMRSRAAQYCPWWSADRLQREQAAAAASHHASTHPGNAGARQQLRHALTTLRRLISRLIPLPRIRP